jgi:GNAT superfamily N-acetyltransferase
VVIAWDVPDLDPLPVRAAWEPLGFEVEVSDVLARSGPPPAPEAPEGYVLRELASEADWDSAFALGMQIGEEDGHDPITHAPFLRRRIAGRRTQVTQVTLRWWGAFRNGQLAAAMGVATGSIEGTAIARYQSVETAPAHRRQGLSSALLGRAAQEALEREPRARLVIVADADGAPGRLYHRAGFGLVERTVAVVRRPDSTP